MDIKSAASAGAETLVAFGLPDATHILEKDGVVIGAAVWQEGECGALFLAPRWRARGYSTFFLRGLRALEAEQKRGGASGAAGAAGVCDGLQAHLPLLFSAPRLDAVWIAHSFLRGLVPRGAHVLDATAGNGHDALFLAQLVGETGCVTALDIQPAAVEATNARLARAGCGGWAKAVCDSHANLARYVPPQGLSAAVFNLGYLPGGSHAVFTQPAVSLPAMRTALEALQVGGVLTACLYSGGAQGTEERDAALHFFRALPAEQFAVLITELVGRGGAAVPVCVQKLAPWSAQAAENVD